MKLKILLLLLFTVLRLPAANGQEPIFPIPVQAGQSKAVLKGDAPYVPTDHPVVLEMLDLAEIVPGDILYDLGCGDGRIIITAAKKFGIPAVGVDLNPDLIRYSRENAAKAGVADRVKFIEQNFFETDIRKGTVITLFLSDAINLKLRPKILKELAPGARVVSNEFEMGDWPSDRRRRLWSTDIYAWVVPANVSGIWEGTIGPERYLLKLNQKFQKIEGTVVVGSESFPIQCRLVGANLEFRFEQKANGRRDWVLFQGRVNGDKIEGAANRQGIRVEWQARRNPSTIFWPGE